MLSGIQAIYANESGKTLRGDEGRCRVCGGPLVGEASPSLKSLSDQWTDESIIARHDSGHICEACAWMTQASNRALLWHKMPAMVVEKGRTRYVKLGELYNILVSADFSFPVVVLCHGEYKEATQKHIEWKANRCISRSKSAMRVAMSGMHLFNTGNGSICDGIAQFDLAEWAPFAEEMFRYAKELAPYMNPKLTPRTKAHMAAKTMCDAMLADGGMSESSYLASYLASYAAFFEEGNK